MDVGAGPVDCVANYDIYRDTQPKHTCHVCLSTGAIIGLSFHTQMGLISLLALLVLVGIIARNYFRLPKHQRKLFQGNIDILMANLIVSDIIMALGAVSDVYWAHHRQVFCGSYCNGQGAIRTIGASAAALFTLEVAAYTCLAIFRVRRPTYRPFAYSIGAVVIWLWVILWAVAPLGLKKAAGLDKNGNVQDYYTPTPWWCWVNGKYMTERILAEYLWLWIAGVGSIVLYVPAYFKVRGYKYTSEPEEHTQVTTLERAEQTQQPGPVEQSDQSKERNESDTRSIASSIHENNEAAKLLWYPFLYTLCVLPWSIIRWAGFVNSDILKSESILAPSMVFFGIFSLMGFFNVGLILWTRPTVLGLGSKLSEPSNSRAVSLENVAQPMSRVSTRTTEDREPGEMDRHGRFEMDETRVDHPRMRSYGGAPVLLNREF